MPNRIIREGWIDSPKIDALSADAERFFLRLMLRADDFGRYTAHSVMLKNTLFPIREDISSLQCRQWLTECQTAGLVAVYTVDGAEYVEIHNFQQRTRANKSKFPAQSAVKSPPCDTTPPSNDGQMTVICQTEDSHPRTETYSETYSEASATQPPSGGGAAAPALALAMAFGRNSAIAEPAIQKWWHESDGRGWLDAKGMPIRKWQSNLISFWVSWQDREGKAAAMGKAKVAAGQEPKKQSWGRSL